MNERHKVRLLAKGLSKKYGIEHEETTTLMKIIAAFLNEQLVVHMTQPDKSRDNEHPNFVCKPKKSR
ncbi:uncharacterized protein PHALS_10786 [Plasmopara halstedii]|uniref:Uncharacterized protein n=1 Tax=Plasmopara halstedii TaxID=4781 RepID=A0A0P1AHW6_PLAHL|nr:uncharacterized protein PHALS_10786 [Plasmopara halstedii]CEG40599.1 hypothetical protein PHALS_10786 [Plasmopara halstedii]|eukprot:XP_024576968.1 hypothetical protein PHALS_10786 [Plasmopara halstedii]